MRKFPKAFARRKSSGNALEDVENNPPAEHTFKVFDRGGESASRSSDGSMRAAKPSTSGPGRSKPSYGGDDNIFENLGNYRTSAGSNSGTASTADNSSRLSGVSTAPSSSTDLPGRNDHRSPHDKPFTNIPPPPVPKSTPTFSLKNAGRTMSWGRTKAPTLTSKDNVAKELPSLPPKTADAEATPSRSRAVTASSYASTATPPKLEEKELGLSLGGDFSDMFAGFGKRKSAILEVEKTRAMSQSPEFLPSAPPNRANRFNSPTHLNIDKNKEIEASPYSWTSQNSHDGLMANRSPPLPEPGSQDVPPSVPQHGQNRPYGEKRVPSKPERSSTDGLRRSSALNGRRQSTLEYTDSVDEDARILRESANANRKLNDPGYSSKVHDSWALPSNPSYTADAGAVVDRRAPSFETTARSNGQNRKPAENEEPAFDSQIAAAADLAERFQERRSSPPPTRPNLPNKVMTPAQFERYRQDKERLKSLGGQQKEEEDDDDETYDDQEDDADRARELAKQRRKQEAHMAVYRQQMMKVTGEAPAGPRPTMMGSHSSPNLLAYQDEAGEEEDEEIPLAILQAHGFPNKNRPPMRGMGSNPNIRASMMAGGGGDSGRLPVFARHLPQDPYIGAGLQNPMHRESLAFGSGAGSVSGATPRGLPPGGLVNVIASEERSRALRRGSPSAQGDFGPSNRASMMGGMGPGQMGGMGPGQMGGMGPMGPMGPMGMNPMMMGQGDPTQMQQQMQQMQQFMQMQMHFMQLMTSGQGPPSQAGPMPGELPSPHSSNHLRPQSSGPNHQRAMTMLEPNAVPWMHPGGFAPSINVQRYSPSIAPSERSTVGMPGRYRPVSYAPPVRDNSSRMSTMSGALPSWENKTVIPTVKVVQKSGNASDEDDEEGWEEMAKKREKKKSIWKTKRDTNGFKDILNFK